jgi:hypothetical protein
MSALEYKNLEYTKVLDPKNPGSEILAARMRKRRSHIECMTAMRTKYFPLQRERAAHAFLFFRELFAPKIFFCSRKNRLVKPSRHKTA